jgi:uncharacterized membrane protein
MIALTALVCAALFAGAAFYVSFVEHPARMRLDDRAALTQWQPSYARATIMQASLALIGSFLAIAAWYRWHSNWFWLAGGLALLANLPFTLLVIMGINGKLKAMAPGEPGADTRELLERWGRLHHIRTLLGVIATALLWYGLKP